MRQTREDEAAGSRPHRVTSSKVPAKNIPTDPEYQGSQGTLDKSKGGVGMRYPLRADRALGTKRWDCGCPV
ncbi:unnamed protein product [Caretta caretta]